MSLRSGTALACFVIALLSAASALCGCSSVSPFNYEDCLRKWRQLREEGYRAAAAKDYPTAGKKFSLALEESKKFGSAKSFQLTSLNDLGSFYRSEHQDAPALRAYEQALSLYLLCVKEHSDGALPSGAVLTALLYMANYYRDTNDTQKAEPLYKLSLIVNEKALQSFTTGWEPGILRNYAKLLANSGRAEEAKRMENEAATSSSMSLTVGLKVKSLESLLLQLRGLTADGAQSPSLDPILMSPVHPLVIWALSTFS